MTTRIISALSHLTQNLLWVQCLVLLLLQMRKLRRREMKSLANHTANTQNRSSNLGFLPSNPTLVTTESGSDKCPGLMEAQNTQLRGTEGSLAEQVSHGI